MDGRNVAEPIAPLICCQSVAWSIPRRSAGLNLTELGQRRLTRLSMRLWPTSCSSRSTSGRQSTSRRSALTPRWTPERARLPRPPCLAAARVTVACAYVLSTVATPLSVVPMLLGRLRAVNESGGGRPPATAHWVAAGPPTKVRRRPQASNSAPFCLILTICLPLVPSLWLSFCLAGATSDVQEPSDGRQVPGLEP